MNARESASLILVFLPNLFFPGIGQLMNRDFVKCLLVVIPVLFAFASSNILELELESVFQFGLENGFEAFADVLSLNYILIGLIGLIALIDALYSRYKIIKSGKKDWLLKLLKA